MQWRAYSLEFNLLENCCGSLKLQFHPGGKPYSSKEDLWIAIQIVADIDKASETRKITKNATKNMFMSFSNMVLVYHLNHAFQLDHSELLSLKSVPSIGKVFCKVAMELVWLPFPQCYVCFL